MKILEVRRGEVPDLKEIDGGLKSMQAVVGGYIEAIYPFDDDIAVVVNEEGKITGLPPNRFLVYKKQNYVEPLCGTLFLCGLKKDSFADIPKKLVDKYTKVFSPDIIYI